MNKNNCHECYHIRDVPQERILAAPIWIRYLCYCITVLTLFSLINVTNYFNCIFVPALDVIYYLCVRPSTYVITCIWKNTCVNQLACLKMRYAQFFLSVYPSVKMDVVLILNYWIAFEGKCPVILKNTRR